MGRFLNWLRNAGRKVNRFIGRASDKVAKVAGVLSNVPIIGNVASRVAKGAELVNKVSNRLSDIGNKFDAVKQRYQPVIDKVKQAGQAIHNSGVLDKLTGGRYSRVVDRTNQHLRRIEQRGNQAMERAERHGQRFRDISNRMRIATRNVVLAAPKPSAPVQQVVR